MKNQNLWKILLISAIGICGLLALFLFVFAQKTEGISDTGISTGSRNYCLEIDAENGMTFVGTYDNRMVTFKDNKEIWRDEADSAYSSLILNKDKSLLYAGNENGHIYVYDVKSGEKVKDIDTERRILAMDITSNEQMIAVATATGRKSANVMVFSNDGKSIYDTKYKIRIGGVKFTSDDENLVISNSRGEVLKIGMDGSEKNMYKTNYNILQMIDSDDLVWVVCKNGSYYAFDNELNVKRQGKVSNTDSATIASIGTDGAGEYVFIGTDEGYLYIMDGNEQPIYTTKIQSKITSFKSVDDIVYMTGLGDFVSEIHADILVTLKTNRILVKIIKIVFEVSVVLVAICVIGVIPKTRKYAYRTLKRMWLSKMAYIMLIPSFLLVILFNYRGILTAFIRAFTDWSTTNSTVAKMNFIGFDNFHRMVEEGYFLIGIKNLVLLMVTGILKTITVPMLVAWLVYSIVGDKRKYVHRFLFVLPIVVPGAISAMTWQKIYDPQIGLLNQILGTMNLENLQRVWLGDPKVAIWAVIFMGFPFIGAMAFLVYYGGLINISHDVGESAMIEGCNRWNYFWKIQLPLIRPQISIMLTLQIIGVMQDFTGIYILTGGGPGTSTYVPALELYLNVSQFGRYGYACALGVILFIFTMVATVISNRITRDD